MVLADGRSTKALAYVLGRDKYIRSVANHCHSAARFVANAGYWNAHLLCGRVWDVLGGHLVRKFKITGGRCDSLLSERFGLDVACCCRRPGQADGFCGDG